MCHFWPHAVEDDRKIGDRKMFLSSIFLSALRTNPSTISRRINNPSFGQTLQLLVGRFQMAEKPGVGREIADAVSLPTFYWNCWHTRAIVSPIGICCGHFSSQSPHS